MFVKYMDSRLLWRWTFSRIRKDRLHNWLTIAVYIPHRTVIEWVMYILIHVVAVRNVVWVGSCRPSPDKFICLSASISCEVGQNKSIKAMKPFFSRHLYWMSLGIKFLTTFKLKLLSYSSYCSLLFEGALAVQRYQQLVTRRSVRDMRIRFQYCLDERCL